MKTNNFNIDTFIQEMSKFSNYHYEGVTRLPFTQESQQAFEYIKTTMLSLGLQVYTDKYGTIQGHLEGKRKESIMIGSHYDSVINGGKYDGVAGIAVALAVIDYFIQNHIVPEYSIDVLALNDEEGVRFTQGFLSSRAIAETLSIEKVVDKESGATLSELLNLNMYGNDKITLSSTLDKAKGYIEVHIEQGLILEKECCDLGLVDNIVGIKRFLVTVNGVSGHAGTIPMEYRSDALVMASKLVMELQNIPHRYKDSVLTIGYFNVTPNAVNVIPNSVVFSIDIRAPYNEELELIEKDVAKICADTSLMDPRNDISISIEQNMCVSPVSLRNEQSTKLETTLQGCDIRYMHINSGAGHDAQLFAECVPTSMLFVPSESGTSHRPDEYTDSKYQEQAVKVLCNYLSKE